MPFYEYRCEACGHEIEALQKVSDEPLLDCPECGRPALKKLMSAVGFRLKGGGWYETDFKSGNKKNLHDSGGGKAAGGGEVAKTTGGESKSTAAPKVDKPAATKPAAAKGA
jgi:putative FmdB family regulatory protein